MTRCQALSQVVHVAGLGDIAVPGLLACLALRFDLSKLLSITSAGQNPRVLDSVAQVRVHKKSVPLLRI